MNQISQDKDSFAVREKPFFSRKVVAALEKKQMVGNPFSLLLIRIAVFLAFVLFPLFTGAMQNTTLFFL